MTERFRRGRQSGALLLMVALLLATMAALSFGLNRAAGMETISVQGDYETRAAGYLAEAAVAAAKWSGQAAGCKATGIDETAFGPGFIAAKATKAPSRRLNIVATGKIGDDVARTIARNEVSIVDLAKKTSSSDLGGALDTTIARAISQPADGGALLALASRQAHALLYWPVAGGEARILSATLILTPYGAVRPVGVHRMMTQWDASATWTTARAGSTWTGGDYGTTAVATAAAASDGTVSWDVTGLVDGWATGRLPNYGILLRLVNTGQLASFHSLDAAAKQRPVLRVVTAKAC